MAEKQIVCDSCGEQWEESFFCEKCSGWHREEVESINFEYLAYPDQETEFEMVDTHYDICLNCCNGHVIHEAQHSVEPTIDSVGAFPAVSNDSECEPPF